MGRLAPEGLEVFSPGEAAGPIVGGTLTQLTSLLGTPWAFESAEAACCFSRTSASARIEFIGC